MSISESTHQITPSRQLKTTVVGRYSGASGIRYVHSKQSSAGLSLRHISFPLLVRLSPCLFLSRVQFSKTATTLRTFSAERILRRTGPSQNRSSAERVLRRIDPPQNESSAETKGWSAGGCTWILRTPEGITWIYATNQGLRGNFCDGSVDGGTATWHERAASKMWVGRANASSDASREHRIEYTKRIQWKQNLTRVGLNSAQNRWFKLFFNNYETFWQERKRKRKRLQASVSRSLRLFMRQKKLKLKKNNWIPLKLYSE